MEQYYTPLFLRKRLSFFQEEVINPRKNGKHLVLGKKNKPNSILLSNCDYLSIAGHPTIVNAQIETLKGSSGTVVMSAVFLQDDSCQSKFEDQIASFVGYESSILCQSGWAANVGLIQSIASKDVPVYIDFIAHMSLWEGIKAADASARPFLHNDVSHLEKMILKNGEGIIVVDSVYSTNGDVCPLSEIVIIAEKYGCLLVVDESHSLGTHGPNGRGLVAELGLTGKVHFITASLAKAFAGRAGIILCSKQFSDYFPFVSYPAIFSSSLLPYEIVGLSKTLEVIEQSNDKRKQLFWNSNYLRDGLDKLGYNVGDGLEQIVALESGSDDATEMLRNALDDRDIVGSVFCYPATPKNKSIVRFAVNSNLTQNNLDLILEVCKEIRDEVGMWEWKSTKRKKRKLSDLES
jgi:7-keto-8-aminopelargonate synthetase-like enzyme